MKNHLMSVLPLNHNKCFYLCHCITISVWYSGTSLFNASLCKKVVSITNDFLQPCQNYSKMYATET